MKSYFAFEKLEEMEEMEMSRPHDTLNTDKLSPQAATFFPSYTLEYRGLIEGFLSLAANSKTGTKHSFLKASGMIEFNCGNPVLETK